MPNGPELRELARRAFAGALFDSYLPQIIYSVRVVPGPESATILFRTTWRAGAVVELFPVRTGKHDLDMVQENRLRIEVEPLGEPRRAHRARFLDLPQERRFWFKISVPGHGTGIFHRISHRSWFSTFRRTATLDVQAIRILSDSDEASAGDLDFTLGVYRAGTNNTLLIPGEFSGSRTIESGKFFRRPFGAPLELGRVPDRIATRIVGFDDDENAFVSFLFAPVEGLQIVGRGPPQTLPQPSGPKSTRSYDSNDLLIFTDLPTAAGDMTLRVTGMTPIGALAFELVAELSCSVHDRLGQPIRASDIVAARVVVTGSGIAGEKTKSQSHAFALGAEGELLWREVRHESAGWKSIEAPPLGVLILQSRPDAPTLLLGVERGGQILSMSPKLTPGEQPEWRALPIWQVADAERPPATSALADGHVVIAARTGGDKLQVLVLDPEGCPVEHPRELSDGVTDDIVTGVDTAGRVQLAVVDRTGEIHAGAIDERDGGTSLYPLKSGPHRLLGIGGGREGGAVVLGIDREEMVAAYSLDDRSGWNRIGPLQTVVQPDELAPLPMEDPPVEG